MRNTLFKHNYLLAILFSLILVCFVTFPCFSGELSEKGKKLFMQNKPLEAITVLEAASKEADADENIFMYLGVANQQVEKWEEAISVFRKGLSKSVTNKHVFLFNIANSYFAQNKNTYALEFYNQAINESGSYSSAYLNRANTKMRLQDYEGALADYVLYLNLEPDSNQASNIQQIIALLSKKTEEDKIAKKQAEEKRIEMEKIAEAKRIAEEQAKQEMLDSVAQSLLEAAEETTNLSAGSGEVQSYEDELSLD